MSSHINTLTEKVAKLKTVGASVRTLLAGLAGRVRAAAGDEAASLALAAEIDAEAEADAQAVLDNTVASTEPPPVEPPVEPV